MLEKREDNRKNNEQNKDLGYAAKHGENKLREKPEHEKDDRNSLQNSW